MPEEQRIHFWTDTNVPINIKERLSGQLIEVYIQLDNLVKFVELNYDGFRSDFSLLVDHHKSAW